MDGPLKGGLQINFYLAVHGGTLGQFPFRWIYHCHSSKSTGKETGKTTLCSAVITKNINKCLDMHLLDML